jgi:hypothetical protein
MSQSSHSLSYHQPECELSIQAKVSPLSQWSEQTILAELDFCLRIGNLQIKGDQQLLQELIIAVANYLEGYLRWDRVGELVNNHQISYGRWRKLELTTLQLFDLHVVLEELTGQCQLLPKISASNRPVWLSMAAILIAVAGVGTWKITNPETVPQASSIPTPVAVRPRVPKPSQETASRLQPQVAPHQRSLDATRETDPQVINRSPKERLDFTSEPSAPPMINPTVGVESAVTPAPTPNLPQGRSPSIMAELRFVSLKKLTAIAPSGEEIDYAMAIAQLNAQLNASSSTLRQKVLIAEAIPRELPLILTAVKVANKQQLWLRAEPHQSHEVIQLTSLLQEALNKDTKIELPAGEYELLLQIVE